MLRTSMPRHQQAIAVEADVGLRQRLHAADEQAGDDEQQQAERHLRRDERLPDHRAAAAAGVRRPDAPAP